MAVTLDPIVQAQCHVGRCPLRPAANQTAGWRTHRRRRGCYPSGLLLLLSPLAPRLSVQRLLGYLDRQASSIPTTSYPIDLPRPATTSTRPALELERE